MPTVTTRRTQTERRDEAYRRMLEAGVRLVAERGFEALTLAEVGIAAGYSRGLPAHHFGSKKEFEGALMAYLQEHFHREMEGYRQRTNLVDLVALVRSLFENADSDPNRLCAMHILLNPAGVDAELASGLMRCRDETAEVFEHQIREGIKKGEIRTDVDPKLTSMTLMLTVNGYLQLWVQDSSVDLKKAGKELAALLMKGLAAPATAKKAKAKAVKAVKAVKPARAKAVAA